MLAQAFFNAQENDTLLFKVFLDAVVDHLGIVHDQPFGHKIVRTIHFDIVYSSNSGGRDRIHPCITKEFVGVPAKICTRSSRVIVMELALPQACQPLFRAAAQTFKITRELQTVTRHLALLIHRMR